MFRLLHFPKAPKSSIVHQGDISLLQPLTASARSCARQEGAPAAGKSTGCCVLVKYRPCQRGPLQSAKGNESARAALCTPRMEGSTGVSEQRGRGYCQACLTRSGWRWTRKMAAAVASNASRMAASLSPPPRNAAPPHSAAASRAWARRRKVDAEERPRSSASCSQPSQRPRPLHQASSEAPCGASP